MNIEPPKILRLLLPLLIIIPAVLLNGCKKQNPLPGSFILEIGSHGYTSGRFHRPRGLVHLKSDDTLVVVDWSGRIQKFTLDGRFRASWIMPEVDKGKPEDLCIAKNGNILVADTHYSRITEFAPDGRWIGSFGRYGRAPGEFIYPVGVCCDSNGFIYVSEYGENDRIQKFTPDGKYVTSWGKFGAAPGDFQRPSGIDLSSNRQLYVADTVNHRVQVFDVSGKLLRMIGKEGDAPGRFRYPQDVAVRGDVLYVLEYGNQRIQKLTLEGKPLNVLGKPGRGDGYFSHPWRCAIVKDSVYVSDTDNSRVVKLKESF